MMKKKFTWHWSPVHAVTHAVPSPSEILPAIGVMHTLELFQQFEATEQILFVLHSPPIELATWLVEIGSHLKEEL